jgi:hypothetical protein
LDKEGPCKKRRLSNAKELNHKFYQMDQNVPVAIEESHTRAGSEMFSQYFLHLFSFQTPININVFLNNSLCFCKYL